MGKRILILQARGQYDAIRLFAEHLSSAFSDLGHEAHLVDLVDMKAAIARMEQVFSESVDLAVGFNGVGVELVTGDNVPLFDATRVPYAGYMLDHPIYHSRRIAERGCFRFFTFVDRTHAAYAARRNPHTLCAFLPHAAAAPADSAPGAEAERDIDVLFAGSYGNSDALLQQAQSLSPSIRELIDEVFARSLAEPLVPLDQVYDGIVRELGFVVDRPTIQGLDRLFSLVDRLLREHRRLEVLDALDKAGIAVDIFGNDWPEARFKHHRIHGPRSFDEALALMARSKLVLNLATNFPNGSHERLFNGMLNGAAVVSESNLYVQQALADVVASYPATRPGDVPAVVAGLLDNDAARIEQASAGQALVLQEHTWHNRAQTLLRMAPLALAQAVAVRDGNAGT